jgi:hypothetical protein
VPLLCALDQQLIVSSAAPLTSLILVNRETLLQARLLSVTLYAVIFSLASVQVQSGGGGNPSLVSSMPSGVVHGPFDSASAPPSSSRGNYLATQSQASYHSASSSPSARRHSSGFDGVNEEANVRANAAVVPGYADVRASAVMTDDNNDDVDDGNFDDTLSEILGTSSRVATSPDLDLAFGAVDVNVDLACTSLLSPLSHLPPPTSSPPSSAAAGEPI